MKYENYVRFGLGIMALVICFVVMAGIIMLADGKFHDGYMLLTKATFAFVAREGITALARKWELIP